MARKIIILEQVGETGDFNIAFWLDVPAARQPFYANATAKSAFVNATTAELTAIQGGAVVEMTERFNRPNGTTQPQLRAALVARQVELQAIVTNSNPWVRYGSSFDGATWTTAGVA